MHQAWYRRFELNALPRFDVEPPAPVRAAALAVHAREVDHSRMPLAVVVDQGWLARIHSQWDRGADGTTRPETVLAVEWAPVELGALESSGGALGYAVLDAVSELAGRDLGPPTGSSTPPPEPGINALWKRLKTRPGVLPMPRPDELQAGDGGAESFAALALGALRKSGHAANGEARVITGTRGPLEDASYWTRTGWFVLAPGEEWGPTQSEIDETQREDEAFHASLFEAAGGTIVLDLVQLSTWQRELGAESNARIVEAIRQELRVRWERRWASKGQWRVAVPGAVEYAPSDPSATAWLRVVRGVLTDAEVADRVESALGHAASPKPRPDLRGLLADGSLRAGQGGAALELMKPVPMAAWPEGLAGEMVVVHPDGTAARWRGDPWAEPQRRAMWAREMVERASEDGLARLREVPLDLLAAGQADLRVGGIDGDGVQSLLEWQPDLGDGWRVRPRDVDNAFWCVQGDALIRASVEAFGARVLKAAAAEHAALRAVPVGTARAIVARLPVHQWQKQVRWLAVALERDARVEAPTRAALEVACLHEFLASADPLLERYLPVPDVLWRTHVDDTGVLERWSPGMETGQGRIWRYLAQRARLGTAFTPDEWWASAEPERPVAWYAPHSAAVLHGLLREPRVWGADTEAPVLFDLMMYGAQDCLVAGKSNPAANWRLPSDQAWVATRAAWVAEAVRRGRAPVPLVGAASQSLWNKIRENVLDGLHRRELLERPAGTLRWLMNRAHEDGHAWWTEGIGARRAVARDESTVVRRLAALHPHERWRVLDALPDDALWLYVRAERNPIDLDLGRDRMSRIQFWPIARGAGAGAYGMRILKLRTREGDSVVAFVPPDQVIPLREAVRLGGWTRTDVATQLRDRSCAWGYEANGEGGIAGFQPAPECAARFHQLSAAAPGSPGRRAPEPGPWLVDVVEGAPPLAEDPIVRAAEVLWPERRYEAIALLAVVGVGRWRWLGLWTARRLLLRGESAWGRLWERARSRARSARGGAGAGSSAGTPFGGTGFSRALPVVVAAVGVLAVIAVVAAVALRPMEESQTAVWTTLPIEDVPGTQPPPSPDPPLNTADPTLLTRFLLDRCIEAFPYRGRNDNPISARAYCGYVAEQLSGLRQSDRAMTLVSELKAAHDKKTGGDVLSTRITLFLAKVLLLNHLPGLSAAVASTLDDPYRAAVLPQAGQDRVTRQTLKVWKASSEYSGWGRIKDYQVDLGSLAKDLLHCSLALPADSPEGPTWGTKGPCDPVARAARPMSEKAQGGGVGGGATGIGPEASESGGAVAPAGAVPPVPAPAPDSASGG